MICICTGVVPRTFIGALLLSWMVFPAKALTSLLFWVLKLTPLSALASPLRVQQQCQYLIRFALLFINIAALSKFRQAFVLAQTLTLV